MNSSLIGVPKRVEILPQTADIDEFVANALRFVIQHIFSDLANAFVITISAVGTPSELWFHDIMSKLFATWGFMAVQLVVRDSKTSGVHVPGRRFCNMILVDSYENLVNSDIAEHNRNYDSMEYYFIFLQIRDAWMPPHRAKILKFCLDNYWLHCNVMLQNRAGEVLIYTYFPFQENACYQTDPVLINRFDGKRFVNDVMFPNKLDNFHKCPLKLSTWNIPPFIVYGEDENDEQQLSGQEMSILKSLSRNLNFKIEPHNKELDGSRISNNKSALMAWEKLIYRSTNITAGFFQRSTERDEAATPSYITYNLPLIPVIFRKESQYKFMSILTFPFDKCTWILIALSCIVVMGINCVRRNSDTRSYKHLMIVQVLLGIPTYREPKYFSRRLIFICWILASFILRCLYQSRLFHLYRTHFYETPPDSLAAMIADRYTAVCTQRSEQFVRNVPEIFNNSLPLIVLETANEMEPLSYIAKNIDKNLVAISVVDFVYLYVSKGFEPGKALITVSVVVNNQEISFYFPKHSYIVQHFNDWILRYHQVGLIDRWHRRSLSSFKISVKTGATTVYDNQLIIDMRQVLSFILIVAIMDLVAIIIFSLEIASKRIKILRRLF